MRTALGLASLIVADMLVCAHSLDPDHRVELIKGL
jgi:hypothetical protein